MKAHGREDPNDGPKNLGPFHVPKKLGPDPNVWVLHHRWDFFPSSLYHKLSNVQDNMNTVDLPNVTFDAEHNGGVPVALTLVVYKIPLIGV